MKQDTVNNVLMTLLDVGEAKMVKIWTLPMLDLLHDVWCPPDVTGFIRIVSMYPVMRYRHLDGATSSNTEIVPVSAFDVT